MSLIVRFEDTSQSKRYSGVYISVSALGLCTSLEAAATVFGEKAGIRRSLWHSDLHTLKDRLKTSTTSQQ